MGLTPNLGLTTYDVSEGASTKVINWRQVISGSPSDMTKIDDWAGNINEIISVLRTSNGINPVIGSIVSSDSGSSYYEAGSNNITLYYDGLMIEFVPNTTSSGCVLLDINGLGVRSLYKQNSDGTQSNLISGDLQAYHGYLFRYSSVNDAWIYDLSFIGYLTGGHVIQVNSGSTVQRNYLNIKSGSNITLSYEDNTSGSLTDITISGSNTYHTISGSSGSQLAFQPVLKFTGDGVTSVVNSAGSTVVTITAGSYSGSSTGGGHVIVDSSGSIMPQETKLKFVGATVTDSSGSTIVTITTGSSSGSSTIDGHIIISDTETLTQRPKMKFTGTGVSVADDSSGSTIVTITAGSGVPSSSVDFLIVQIFS